MIECDLHERYGIDVGDDGMMVARHWPWLRTRILGLLSSDTRLVRQLFPPPPLPTGF